MSSNGILTSAEEFVKQVRWMIPCCPNCEHFSSSPSHALPNEHCTLDPQKRLPPAKVVAFGCPRFVQQIPF